MSGEVSQVRKEAQVGGVQVAIEVNSKILLSCRCRVKAFSADEGRAEDNRENTHTHSIFIYILTTKNHLGQQTTVSADWGQR